MARALRIESPTTACIVTLSNPRFEDAQGFEDPEFITMSADMQFNGITMALGDNVTFARNATTSVKNAAIRAKVNQLISTVEIGVTLNNANIQIVGLPV